MCWVVWEEVSEVLVESEKALFDDEISFEKQEETSSLPS
jgi:hypothetical protein